MVRQPAIEFVDKWYEMDPTTEDLLFDGKYLQDGMVVLPGHPHFRADTTEEITPDRAHFIKIRNRWASISHVTFGKESVYFLATYGDGTKQKVDMDIRCPWLVKLDSLPMQPAGGFEYGKLRGHPSRDNEVAMRTYDLNDQGTPRHLEEHGDHTAVFRFREEDKALGLDPEWVGDAEARWQAEKGTSITGH